MEAILAEARQARADETATAFRALGRSIAWAWRKLIAGPGVRYWRRRRLEAELSALSDQMLADIGLNRSDIPRIVREAYRPRLDDAAAAPTTLHEVKRAADATKRAA